MAIYTKSELTLINKPDDLGVLIKNFECCQEMLKEMQCRFFEEDEDVALVSHSYLSKEDKKNKAILATVSAIDDVFKYITFVMEVTNHDLVGYWHGPENLEITESAIILYDTEGQFSILNGKNISEAIVGNYLFDQDDEFMEFKTRFEKCGIQIASKWSDLLELEPKTNPSKLYDKLYEEYLAKLKT